MIGALGRSLQVIYIESKYIWQPGCQQSRGKTVETHQERKKYIKILESEKRK